MLNGFHIVAVVVDLFALSEMVLQSFGTDLTRKAAIDLVRISFSSLLITLKH
jgi:putative tricarboxylic transport membrane protein